MARGASSGGPKGTGGLGGGPDVRPGASTAQTDAESGNDGSDSARRGLRALDVMRDRGLISREEYDQRRAALLGGQAGPRE
ncbi:SHOCT domain-containing protein [Arenibaculum sp.]|jgi:hypothetical protein|uniref:SHOCT domain-containing protein n=1 Tax=Arenibaculum sp. TaxID=2865862 RepID=UPI002E13A6BE|nr:SHOCT domain-containing protein [Arenibaculum sp.]